MSSPAPLVATSAVQDDVRPEELHCNSRDRVADACNDCQGSRHNNELKELISLHVPTHGFTQKSTTLGLEYPPSRDQTPKNSVQEMTTKTSNDMGLPVHASETMDHCSLRSSTQTTLSSALSKSVRSSGADSSAKTVSTAPTSIISCSSGLSGIREVEKGVFAAPKMILDLQDRLAWDKIQPKLQDTIFNTFRPRKDLDDTISCEFMMGGPSPTRLTPTVFLVCCHELYRKQLRSILKRQKWMRAYEYQCVVIVDTLEDLSFGALADSQGPSQLLVEAFVPSGRTSWFGSKARARSTHQKEPINFTIGGILLIDNEAFGLTVRHGFDGLVHAYDVSSDREDDSGEDDSSSPFITFQDTQLFDDWETEKSSSVLDLQKTGPRVCMNLVDDDSTEKTQCGGEWHHFGQSDGPNIVGSTIICGKLDWSLVKFEPQCEISHLSLVNNLVTTDNDHLQPKSFLDKYTMTGGEVLINAGSTGPVKGWLVDCPALLHRNGKSFEVLQVITDQPLAPGDSGSWVLMANVLYGHVLASRKSVPWLYVLPISETLAEAKNIMSCQDIDLPQHHMHFDLPTLASDSGDSSSHDSTITFLSRTTTMEYDINKSRQTEPPVPLQQWPPIHNMTDIIRACLGSLYLERAGLPHLDYTAFEDHCLSCLKDYEAVMHGSLPNESLRNSDVFDILQMIKTGLNRDEVEDTLGQRTGLGSRHYGSIQERVDRVASLLVMTEISHITHYGRRARILWTSGTLQQAMNEHFTHEMALTDSSIRLEHSFTAKNLVRIAGLRIFWTANLSDHLLLDRKASRVHIFHYATYLECQRKSFESLLPDGLAEETLTSLALLFPSSTISARSSRSVVSFLLRKYATWGLEQDKYLHAIREGALEPHERDIRNFHYWHDRIVILKQAFDETPSTLSLAQLWYDRRDYKQWYTFWAATLFGILGVCTSLVQVSLAGLQHWNSSQILAAIADQRSPTDLPLEPPISRREESSGASLSPGAIAGIIIGGLASITVLGALSAWILMPCRSQSTKPSRKTIEQSTTSLASVVSL